MHFLRFGVWVCCHFGSSLPAAQAAPGCQSFLFLVLYGGRRPGRFVGLALRTSGPASSDAGSSSGAGCYSGAFASAASGAGSSSVAPCRTVLGKWRHRKHNQSSNSRARLGACTAHRGALQETDREGQRRRGSDREKQTHRAKGRERDRGRRRALRSQARIGAHAPRPLQGSSSPSSLGLKSEVPRSVESPRLQAAGCRQTAAGRQNECPALAVPLQGQVARYLVGSPCEAKFARATCTPTNLKSFCIGGPRRSRASGPASSAPGMPPA